jgi:iron complex outermembrane receptor protein
MPPGHAAWAQAAAERRTFDIAAQPLASALLQLSRQGDVDIAAPERLTRGHTAPAVKGAMTAERAMTLLLARSGLRFRRTERGGFIVMTRPPAPALPASRPAPRAAARSPAQMPVTPPPPVEDIVVTAQRRSEALQGVPISINALEPAMLRALNVRTSDQLQFTTSGFVNTSTAGDGITTAYIRGVGTGYSGPGLESSVAVYLDDVYLQSQTESAQAIFDVSQVQVLKGPQGTLYGRNATGGAIVITTADPALDRIEGYAQLGLGNLDRRRLEAVLNLPLGTSLAARFAGYHESRDGYVRNVAVPAPRSGVGSGQAYTGRLKLLWQPDETLKAVFKAQYDRHDGNGAVHSLRFAASGAPTGLGYYETSQSPNREGGGGDDTNALTLSARLEYRPGDWILSNTFAYRRTRSFGCTDNDGLPQEVLYFCLVSRRSPDPLGAHGKEDSTVTNELRLVSEHGGPIDVTAGLFAERNRARFVGRVGGTLVGSRTPTFDNGDGLTAYSAFGELYYRMAERLKLTAGLRYTHERKSHTVRLDADMLALRPELPAFDRARTEFSDLSPRLVLTYEGERLVAYASFNQGFKSGGFNSPAPDIDPPLAPERISAVELGGRFRSADGKTRISAALFHYDWKDVQVAFITGGGAGIMQQNAAGARVTGLEFGLDHRSRQWRANLGVTYSHGRFTRFPNAAVYDVIGGRLQATAQDLGGYRLPQGPDFTATGSVTRYVGLPGGWSSSITAGARFSSAYDFTAGAGGELKAARQPAFALVNLHAALTSPDERWELGGFVTNLFSQHHVSLISTGDTGVYMTPAEPRTYGLTLRRSF